MATATDTEKPETTDERMKYGTNDERGIYQMVVFI